MRKIMHHYIGVLPNKKAKKSLRVVFEKTNQLPGCYYRTWQLRLQVQNEVWSLENEQRNQSVIALAKWEIHENSVKYYFYEHILLYVYYIQVTVGEKVVHYLGKARINNGDIRERLACLLKFMRCDSKEVV